VFTSSGWPVLVGTSRKGFLGRVVAGVEGLAAPLPVDDRLEGSLATATWALAHGAAMVRVHDVAATVQAVGVLTRSIERRNAA
jgi:dihydropteroate synthase